jgi:hypothetical protein
MHEARVKGWLTLAAIVLAAGVVVSVTTAESQWFARSGCILVVIGVYMTGTEFLLHGSASHASSSSTMNTEDDPGYKEAYEADMARREYEGDRYDPRFSSVWLKEWIGFYLVIAGSVIWEFGDLLGG